jgi:RHS repeat-associated protein
MVRTLSKTSGGYTVSAETVVDPWGAKLSSGTGEKRDYCASIGHVTDDESGLVYMRARYYEPGTGRFVSEDPARDGRNHCIYVEDDPVKNTDSSGLVLDDIEFTAVNQAAEMAASRAIGKCALGKVTELVLFVETKYAMMGLTLTGWGVSRVGEAAIRFTTSLGNIVIFRFNANDNLLKFSTNGPNYGVQHHINLSEFANEFSEWLCEHGF